ncbi:hypothetical protein L1987_58062 [Smallanthus sonchifolius]|uniref:Uncharacterized protein n=1 Tax=Smallanthus sonchifolius TaxID=185202 RepID=A0ACB9DF14_9ASTR|nr:hypothetical protein L1987_58062 [Smallanthus sonchifolius]
MEKYNNTTASVISGKPERKANFSAIGPSTFHVHHKKIEAKDIYRRLNGLLNGSSKMEELATQATPCNEEGNIDLSDFEICSDNLQHVFTAFPAILELEDPMIVSLSSVL